MPGLHVYRRQRVKAREGIYHHGLVDRSTWWPAANTCSASAKANVSSPISMFTLHLISRVNVGLVQTTLSMSVLATHDFKAKYIILYGCRFAHYGDAGTKILYITLHISAIIMSYLAVCYCSFLQFQLMCSCILLTVSVHCLLYIRMHSGSCW